MRYLVRRGDAHKFARLRQCWRLELESKWVCESSVADEAAADREERFVDLVVAVVADEQSFELVQPGEGAFDDPAHLAEAGAVLGLAAGGDPSNPEINGGIAFRRSGGVGVDLDGFPSFELYHRARQGGSPTCKYRFGETTPYALTLPALVPGADEGKSHC